MANKEERIAGIIRKSITEIITMELKNPHLGFVTIPEVKVSKDFSYAKVYVSFMFEDQIEDGMKVLEKSKGFIRSGLAKRLDTRRCPELVFVLDESFKREARITELLNKDKEKQLTSLFLCFLSHSDMLDISLIEGLAFFFKAELLIIL